MKKLLSLLPALLLALLCGCAAGPGGTPDAAAPTPAVSTALPAPETQTPVPTSAPEASSAPAAAPGFDEAVTGQVFAAVMAAYDGDFPDGTLPDSPAFLTEATGWYAAWRWRTSGVEMISTAEAEAFQHSLGSRGALVVDPAWEEYGYVWLGTDQDGTEGFYATWYKYELENRLGVTLELKSEAENGSAVDTALICHFENGDTLEKRYRLFFAPDEAADGFFPYRLSDMKLPPAGPQMDPAFDFDWELLLAQNRLSTLLRPGDGIKLEYSYFPDRETWIVNRGGDLCILDSWYGWITGEYRGARFEYSADPEETARVRLTDFDGDAGSWEHNDGFLSDYFSGKAIWHFDGIENDRIRIRAVTEYGRRDFEIDRGTLVLKKASSYFSDADEPAGVVTVSYAGELPELSFLDGWDRPLRRVTCVWEDFYDGDVHVREETHELPSDWEYRPWQGIYGDYTIYMDMGYTRSYFYPGDGMDYTLYLSTAKG